MDWTGYGEEFEAEVDEEHDIIISQSTIESMLLCPARVGLAHEPGFIKSVSEPMLFGTLVHKLVELVVDDTYGTVLTPSLSEIEELWLELALEDGVELYTVGSDEQIDASVNEARFAMQSFAAWWAYESRPFTKFNVEVRIHRPLGVVDGRRDDLHRVWVGGTPDCVAWPESMSYPKIYDWKTAGNDKYAKGAGLTRIQSPLYTWLALGEPTFDVDFDYIVWNRKAGRWDRHPLVITPASVEAAKRTAWQWAKMIATDSYPGTPGGESYGKYRRGWHCSAKYCGAWEICPFKGLIPDDVDLEEKINRGW